MDPVRTRGLSVLGILGYILDMMVLWILWGTLLTHADALDCVNLKSVEQVLECALRDHPDSRLAQASLEQAPWLEEVAAQRPNPELNTQAVVGSTRSGQNYTYAEFNLAQTIELGGKRGSRVAMAQAQVEQRKAGALGVREQILISTLLALYRVRQLQTELETLNGALESFQRVQKQYKSRPRLTPEQTASLRIFEIAQGDYRLRLAPVQAELNQELHTLEHALGHPFTPSPEVLPAPKNQWPELKDTELAQPVQGSHLKLAASQVRLAQTELELARGLSWPDLKLGPTFELQRQGGDASNEFNVFGLNLTFQLPVLHANGAGRALALSGVSRSELAQSAAQIEGQHEREYHFRRYQTAVAALKESLSTAALLKKHDEVETLFERGLLAGQLLIEIHRQLIDFTRSQNAQELAAIESLAKFYAFQGKLFEVKL